MSRIQVGREIRSEWGWLWARTKRLANLLQHPNVLRGAIDIVQGLDRWCDDHGVAHNTVRVGDAKFIRGVQYLEYPLHEQ